MDKRKKLIIAGACAAVAVILIVAVMIKGGSKGGGPGAMPGPAGMMGQESMVSVVKAAEPEDGDLSVTTSLVGSVEASDVVYVYAKAAGDVTAVHVKAGDFVQQGQVLCEIDTDQVETAKNSMDSAKVSMTEAQNNLSRMQILYQGNALSAQEYEQYVNQAESARLQYESAKLAYDRQVEYSTITAPISGRIESCDAEVYDRVSQSEQLLVIAGEGENRITFYVSQRMMKNLREGDTLEIMKNGKTYNGTISEVNSMVDSESGLFKIKAEMENTDEIAIGSSVKLNVVTDRAENAMLVPINAVYYSGGDAFVYLYQDGTAVMKQVEVGLYDDEYAEITSGLSVSDMVISTWSSNLYEGATVRLMEEAQDAAETASNQKNMSTENRETTSTENQETTIEQQ